MAPAPKKSKLTMASSSIASSSKPGPPPAIKAPKPARKEETLSDLEDEDDQSMDGSDEGEGDDFSDDGEGEMGDEFDLGGGQREGVEDYDTEDEIERVANEQGGPEKSKKTAKRKRRATSPSTFGSLLSNLLSTDPSTSKQKSTHLNDPSKSKADTKRATSSTSQTQGNNILSLAPSIKKTISARQLETRARKVLAVSRLEKEDKGRVKDVIGGWGGREDGVGGQEWERGLRKVAQKGVVRLFNTILLSASQSEAAGSNAKRLDAPEPLPDPKKKKEKDNILGRGGRNLDGGRVTKEGFEALLKGGGA